MNGVHDCKLVELPKIPNPQGNITVVEGATELLPFEIERVFYLYDVVGGADRGGHAHKELHQFIVATMGSFTVSLWDGEETRDVELNRAYWGLHVPPLVWSELVNFSSGAVAVVLASLDFDEADYLRDRDAFVQYRHQHAAR